MEIKEVRNAENLHIGLKGRLDSTTAPELEKVLYDLSDVKALTFDFADLKYISSAGLRVLLKAQKQMNRQGTMVVKNVNDDIREVFDITGFSDIMTIE